MKSQLEVKGGLWLWLVTSELWSANIMWGSGGLCEGLRGKRLLGLVKIKWPITCFLPLFELSFCLQIGRS